MLENERESMVPDQASGSTSSESFATRVHGSWLSRTSEDSLFGEAIVFSGTLPTAGTMRNGKLYARATSGRHSFAPGSSSWPTPRAEDSESSGRRQGRDVDDTLTAKARAAGGTPLLVQVQRWPTPVAGDAKGAGSRNLEGSEAHAGVSLTDAVRFGNSTTPRNWATPLPSDVTGGRTTKGSARQGETGLRNQAAATWPTPTAMDSEAAGGQGAIERGTRGHSLHTAATMFPTPAARDYRSPNAKPYKERGGGKKGEQLNNFVAHGPAGPPDPESPSTPGSLPGFSPPLVLNALWVSTLMGFPIDWLDEF